MKTINVINEMLASMGEAPLNAITDEHPLKGAGLALLDKLNSTIQAQGWHFNRLPNVELVPGALDENVYLPGNYIAVTCITPYAAQRGRRIYNLETGTWVWTKNVVVTAIHLVDFEELPELAAAYIAAEAVLQFQTRYDGDTAKTRDLRAERDRCKIELMTVEIRDVKANLALSNPSISRIRAGVNRLRALAGRY